MTISESIRDRYCDVSICGQRITRMEELSIGSFDLSSEIAWTLGTDNLGLFVGGIGPLRSTVEILKQLESPNASAKWIIISASKSLGALISQMWITGCNDDIVVKRASLPQIYSNVVLATPESLSRIADGLCSSVAGLVLVDPLCHVHRARRMPGRAGRFVKNDRPQMVADFRSSLAIDNWAPPLLLLTEEPAKSVHTDHIARAYCLDGFWFLDGRTLQVVRQKRSYAG